MINARDKLQTGDIVLFSGRGLISRIIQVATRSKWSHVGMILKLSEYNFVTIWESTTLSSVINLSNGKATKGVQLVSFTERVATYDGDIAIRQLIGNRDQLNIPALMALRQELRGRSYEQDKIELARSALDLSPDQTEDLSSLFCSELVAEAYKRLGVMDDVVSSNEYTPADFDVPDKLFLNYDLQLGPIEYV